MGKSKSPLGSILKKGSQGESGNDCGESSKWGIDELRFRGHTKTEEYTNSSSDMNGLVAFRLGGRLFGNINKDWSKSNGPGDKMELEEAIHTVKQRYKTDIERITAEKEVIKKFGSIFDPANLDSLIVEDFKSFLLYKNNRHWDGIHRQGNMITSDMGKLKYALKILLDETKPIKERIDKLMPKNKPPLIRGLGRAVLTPILLVVHPDKYAVFNSITEDGMKELGIFPNSRNESFAEKYTEINEIITNLAKQNGLSLWQIDEVWWYGTTDSTDWNGEEETKTEQVEEEGLPTEVESQLEDLLIGNWERIPEFNDLEILQEDGEYIGQQYDTKEVGRIDILCKNKKTGDFVVVELKRGRESDKVVGQILRYIGWVKKKLANENQKVCGLIITYEDDPKLRYSLEPVKELIQLKFYKISITIS